MPELRVRRDDLAACEIVDDGPSAELAEGEARLRVERFALTSNNVSYALLGDELGYWRLFPAPQGWGRVPAWGYADVVASRSPAVEEGARVFGLVPMASHFNVLAKPHRVGFVDAAQHRAELSPLYNQYLPTDDEPADTALVMRPLFGTAVVLESVLSEAGFYGGRTVVLTSASSKTCYGVAHLLRERVVQTVGLTSAAHRDWVERLDLYDEVVVYDHLGELRVRGGAVLVDFAGDRELLRRIHERLGSALRQSTLVGFTHWHAERGEAPLPGPVPEFFFAPAEMARRGRGLWQRYAEAWQTFAPIADRAMRIEQVADGDALVRVWGELLEGRTDPAVAYVVGL